MSKYIFKKLKNDDKYAYDGSEITVELDAVDLPTILEEFKHFLLACGFYIDQSATLELSVEEEE